MFRDRPCRSEDDFRPMLNLASRAWAALGPLVGLHPGDLCWRFFRATDTWESEDFRLWFDPAGCLAAWAQYQPHEAGLDSVVRPDCLAGRLERAILDWAEPHCATRLDVASGAPGLTVGAFDGDARRQGLLLERGYRRLGSSYLHFIRSLGSVPERKALPGHEVRALAGVEELRRTAGRGCEVYGRGVLTERVYERMVAAGVLAAGQDVVALDSGGVIRAACLWWYDAATRTAELEPVGCHEESRRMGLASAVIAEALRLMRSRGAERAVVYTDAANAAAVGCYSKAGFTLAGTDRNWRRDLG